jgi:pyrimidine operon attenuation protein/uracil phosphoribosyltransferase
MHALWLPHFNSFFAFYWLNCKLLAANKSIIIMAGHLIFSKEIAYQKIHRMAYEIVEQNVNEKEVILAGIKENGSVIAAALSKILKEIFKGGIKIIEIKINKKIPKQISLSEKIDFDNKVIIVVDDVANSGKTLLYALKPFLDFYPKKIQTLVLVERSYKEFPIAPDYVGLSVSTASTEKIIVDVSKGQIESATLNAG